ncbi:hypothetical protein G7046_g3941 [Stylonectria norvegica]|nr:hypothetical protein G7046_g3941 [Stylonectria norvegica]
MGQGLRLVDAAVDAAGGGGGVSTITYRQNPSDSSRGATAAAANCPCHLFTFPSHRRRGRQAQLGTPRPSPGRSYDAEQIPRARSRRVAPVAHLYFPSAVPSEPARRGLSRGRFAFARLSRAKLQEYISLAPSRHPSTPAASHHPNHLLNHKRTTDKQPWSSSSHLIPSDPISISSTPESSTTSNVETAPSLTRSAQHATTPSPSTNNNNTLTIPSRIIPNIVNLIVDVLTETSSAHPT